MSDCLPCTPVNPCYNCGCQESCNCPAPPLYTNESCPNGVVGSNCVTLKNDTETCIGINTNTTTLTSFIDKIITYVKNVRNRFISTDGSLSITPINDLCNDKANIKVNIDPNLNNAIVLNANGLYVAPVSTNGTVYIGTDPIVVTGNIISVNEATQLQGGILNASATIQDIGGPKRFDNYIIVDSTVKIWKGPNLNSRTNLGIGDPTILGSLTAGANGNTALGTYIMYAATTSSFNTGVGSGSLYRLTTGNSNNFVGASSGEFITTGNYNVGVGEQILSSAIIGNNNTAIGSFSGSNLDVSGCVFIGYKAGRGPGLDNELHIGNSTGTSDLIYGKFDTNLFRVNGTLEVTSLKTTGVAPTPIGVTKLVTTDENGQQSFIDIPISGGGGTTYTASNGLTEIGTNIKLGGTLTENTNINAPGFGLSLIGTNSTSPLLSIDHTTLNDGYALQIKSAGAVGVGVLTVNGTAGLFENQALPLISRSLSASTAFYRPLLRLYNTPVGVAENGLGGNIDVYLKDSLNTENRAGVMGFDITDVNNATFTSRFRLQTKGNGILNEVLQIDGLGKVKLNKYGLGTFTGIAAYNLAIDASGNIIEAAAGGGGGTTYTASNGLTEIGTNIKLGGTLVENTNINSDIHSLIISGSFGGTLFNTINNATQGTAIRGDINGEAGIGVFGNSSFNGTGVKGTGTYGVMGVSVTGWGTMGESTSGVGIFGSSETGDPGFFSKLPLTTNTVERVLRLERTVQGTPQNGIGASIDLLVRDLSFAVNSSNKIITKLIDVTSGSRTSELSFTGYSAGVENTLLQILGTGATKLTKYGLGTFTGTAAYNLATDASGNIIEVAAAGGGTAITLTTTGTSGVATLVGTTLNIPNYATPVIQVTRNEAIALINSNTLIPERIYKIKNVEPTLYDDGTNSGTGVYLKAYNENTFYNSGIGEFYNINYDPNNNLGRKFWNNFDSFTVGERVNWGGYKWECVIVQGPGENSGTNAPVIGTSQYDFVLGNKFTKLPYSTIGEYKLKYDKIVYNIINDAIITRHDEDHNNIVEYNTGFFNPYFSFADQISPIKHFAFFYASEYSNDQEGVYNTKVINSTFNNINYKHSTKDNRVEDSFITFTETGDTNNYINKVQKNIFRNTVIRNFTLRNESYFFNNVINNCDFNTVDLSAGLVTYNQFNQVNISNFYTLFNSTSNGGFVNCDLKSFIFNTGSSNLIAKEIAFISGNGDGTIGSLANATHIFRVDAPTHASKTIYSLPNGEVRISYRDNTNTEINALVTT